MRRKNMGSAFDDFLKEEGIYEETQAAAVKCVIAFQIRKYMKRYHITKKKMSEKMETSRSQLDRLLEPSNKSVTLLTLEKAASAIGKKLQIRLV